MRDADRKIRVFIVDDHELLRLSLQALLSEEAALEVVGEAGEVAGLPEKLLEAAPDVILMDITLGPGKPDGLEGSRVALRTCPDAVVVVLTMHEDERMLEEAARAGASGYVLKSSKPDELLDAIKVAATGGGWLSPSIARRTLQRIADGGLSTNAEAVADTIKHFDLTDREIEILRLTVHGATYEEIAHQLFLSTSQIKQVASGAAHKLGARDKAHAAAIAVSEGIVPPLVRR